MKLSTATRTLDILVFMKNNDEEDVIFKDFINNLDTTTHAVSNAVQRLVENGLLKERRGRGRYNRRIFNLTEKRKTSS